MDRRKIVVLATGGTIAGRAASATDNVGYRAAELGVAALLHGIDAPAGCLLEAEEVAQVDSKDMDEAVWCALVERAARHLARDDVAGIVVTHGTDTMEETAWLLHAVLAPAKPVVLTGAMRPASSLSPDGPQNLADALAVAALPGARGVSVVFAGRVHGAADVVKLHPYRVDAFASVDAGPLARIEEGVVEVLRPWPVAQPWSGSVPPPGEWPWVEVVTSHAGAGGHAVAALVAAGVRGLVVAGTGNGTIHQALHAALRQAEAAGVEVRCASRCLGGRVVGTATAFPAVRLSPAQARVALQLALAGDARPISSPPGP